ncbi:RnfH family protein [Hydrogenophaga sp. ANAO-22]|jgi:putative ubiquitin-RnfH superfamily antitoxin RatB of RatAB toxin-antitoxin module|uniref:RnfH family protein n=1 Tax=Hydrogenophaga sp. ANAO-22 TaxID=3166645 RepID=UPI0036D3FCFB
MKITLMHAPAPREVVEEVLDVPEGCTLRQALDQAGWLQRFPDIEAEPLALGIWGRKAGWDRLLREGDRVEVVRGLRVDPKVARRERFMGQGARSTGLFARRRPGSKAGY